MTTYEVHCFPARGRAEPTRLALAAAGASFKNVTPAWPAEKAKYAFGQLPVLVEHKDGKTLEIPQSMAMLRHVGRVFDLYGKDAHEQAQVDILCEGLTDVYNNYIKAVYQSGDNKEAELKKFSDEYLPKQISIFDGFISKNGSGHCVGASLTIADLFLYHLFTNPNFKAPTTPTIQKVIATVEANPGIAAYLMSDKLFEQ